MHAIVVVLAAAAVFHVLYFILRCPPTAVSQDSSPPRDGLPTAAEDKFPLPVKHSLTWLRIRHIFTYSKNNSFPVLTNPFDCVATTAYGCGGRGANAETGTTVGSVAQRWWRWWRWRWSVSACNILRETTKGTARFRKQVENSPSEYVKSERRQWVTLCTVVWYLHDAPRLFRSSDNQI